MALGKCPDCSNPCSTSASVCPNCGAHLLIQEQVESQSASCFTTGLRFCGWIDFIVGIFAGVILFASAPTYGDELYKLRPFFIGFAVGAAFQGFLFFALFNVIAEIAENLAAMRKDLLNRGH
jgi:hypothetical protein